MRRKIQKRRWKKRIGNVIWRRLTLVVNVKDPNDVVLGETKGVAMRIEVFAARGAHIGDLRKRQHSK